MYAPTLPAMTSNQNNSCKTLLLYINIRSHNLQPLRNHYHPLGKQSTNSTKISLPTRIVG